MNKAKAYSYLGAMLGTGAGFGVGYGVSLLVDKGWPGAFALYFIILVIVGALEEKITKSLPGLILVYVAFVYYPVVLFFEVRDLFLWAIPFAALGTIHGYEVGRPIGKKAEKIREYKAKYEQLKREGYEPDEELEGLLK